MAQIAVSGISQVRKEQQQAHDLMAAKHAAVNERMDTLNEAPRARPMPAGGTAEAPRFEMATLPQARDGSVAGGLQGLMSRLPERGREGGSGGMQSLVRAVVPEAVRHVARTQAPRMAEMAASERGGGDPPEPARPPPQVDPRPDPSRERPLTEIEGGDIPTTTDEWESRREWEEFQRRQETTRGLREIAQIREQARLDEAKAGVSDRRQEIATGMKDQALAEADAALAQAGVDAADQERRAQVASYNVEALVEQRAAQRAEIGAISEQAGAAIEERRLQIEQISTEAAIAIEDSTLAAQKAEADAAVMSAARGAGGQVVEQQAAGRRADLQRQVGRIGVKRNLATGRMEQQVKGIQSRARMATRKTEAAIKRTTAAVKTQRRAYEGAVERRQLILDQGALAADKIRLQAATFEADAAGIGLDAEAARVNARFAIQAAQEGLEALADRPPIPDWNAIGKKAEAAQRWARAGGIIGFGAKLLGSLF